VERTIERQRSLPGGRAVLGGLLMAVAAIGVYVAVQQASSDHAAPVVVAARPIHVGDVVEPDDVELVDLDLPADQDRATFADLEGVVGHVALGPIGEGEVVQASVVTDEEQRGRPRDEIALRLPRGQVAVGRLKEGERVDVFVTYDDRTTSVVRGVEVVRLSLDEDDSLTSDREIELVVSVTSGEAVAALVHALRTGDVTVVRSTFDSPSATGPVAYESSGPASSADDG
jgi:Flp pilus assembly protein CpaB